MLPQFLRLLPCVRDFLEQNSGMWGVKVVTAMMQMPERYMHGIRISHFIEPQNSTLVPQSYVEDFIRNEDLIPMTDDGTLKAIDREKARLEGFQAKAVSDGHDCSSAIKQIEALDAYIRQTTRQGRTINNFSSAETREYRRHYMGVKRLLAKSEKECPEAGAFIKAHLIMGVYFFWSEEELTAKHIKLLEAGEEILRSDCLIGDTRC